MTYVVILIDYRVRNKLSGQMVELSVCVGCIVVVGVYTHLLCIYTNRGERGQRHRYAIFDRFLLCLKDFWHIFVTLFKHNKRETPGRIYLLWFLERNGSKTGYQIFSVQLTWQSMPPDSAQLKKPSLSSEAYQSLISKPIVEVNKYSGLGMNTWFGWRHSPTYCCYITECWHDKINATRSDWYHDDSYGQIY